MTDIDPQTARWLHSLKLNKNFKSISDFENGYSFGLIFDKLQLTKGKKFKNSSDMACVFHNYKNVKDLLMENFALDFPINNIIYRTEDLLKTIRDEAIKYQQKKKQATLKAVTTVRAPSQTMIQPQEQKIFNNREKEIMGNRTTYMNQTTKLPRKIQQIEHKLQKFREEKTRHEILALEDRKYQIEQNRRMIQNHREYEISKIRQMHENGKEKERKVYDIWAKTEKTKHDRIEKDNAFNNFMKEKKNKFYSSLRNDQEKTFKDGLEAFQLNCIRHGIELDHDPDKPLKPDGQFNKVVVMERIKDNIKKHEEEKKEIKKRQNKKRVDAGQAKQRSEEIWNENNKLEAYKKKFSEHFIQCESLYKVEQQKQAERQTIKQKINKKQFVDLPAIGNEETRKEEFRQRKLQYLKNDVTILENRYNQLYSIAEQVVEALLQTTIEGEEMFQKEGTFSYLEWKEVEKVFLSSKGRKKIKGRKTDIFTDHSNFDNSLLEYIQEKGFWRNFAFQTEIQSSGNQQFASVVDTLIQISYPGANSPPPSNIPLHMPLKLVFSGERLTGKSTLSAKFAQKFSLPIIDPIELLKEALELAKPPVEQDPKKAKKDAKKPEEMTQQKIALKEYGAVLLQKGLESHEKAGTQNLIDIIKFRIKQLYSLKSLDEQFVEEYQEAKRKQEERHAQALKDFQEGAKKPKKDSKKPANEVVEEPPKPNPLFYSSGFIIDNYPVSLQSVRMLEREVNSYICEDEKINNKAEEIKKKFSLIISIPSKQVDTRLKNGVFDYCFELKASSENVEKRKTGRKIDPSTKIIYHNQFNPIPTEIKGFAEKLVDLPPVENIEEENRQIDNLKKFYQVFGDEKQKIKAFQEINTDSNIDESFECVFEMIKKRLVSKYADLEERKVKLEEKKQKQKKEEVQENEQKQEEQEKEQKEQKEEQEQEKIEENKQDEKEKVEQSEKMEDKQQNLQKEREKKQNKWEQKSLKQLVECVSKTKSQSLIQRYDSAILYYTQGIKQCMHLFEAERNEFEKNLLSLQKQFTNLINRPDDKAGKILAFQQNYNKLLIQQENIVKDVDASKHLIKKLDEVYDSLWESLCGKKNEAVEERLKFIQSDWMNKQAEKIVEIGRKLLQIQLNLLCQGIFLILCLSCQIQNKSAQYVTEYLSLGIAPSLEPIDSIDKQNIQANNRLQYYLNQVDRCLEDLPRWIDQKRKKMKIENIGTVRSLLDGYVGYYKKNMEKKKALIKKKIMERILQEKVYYNVLINKMDEWIIQGIKSENDFVYEIYKTMKKSIEEAKKSNVKDFFMKEITDVYQITKGLTFNPMPLRTKTFNRHLPIYSYMIFVLQIKTISNNFGKINFDTLKKYFMKRKKSNLLDPRILNMDFDTISQYLVKDGLLEFKELATAIVLWNINVFDDDALAKYKGKLLKESFQPFTENGNPPVEEEKNSQKSEEKPEQKSEKQEENEETKKEPSEVNELEEEKEKVEENNLLKKKESFIRSSPVSRKIFFDDLIMMEGAFDEQEAYILKHFIFEIFREESAEYIDAQSYLDTLSLFDQLQVLRYGDTVMMLQP